MTLSKITLLCCLPALCAVDVVAGGDALIVGPGESLSLAAPEAGARLEAALDGGPLKPIGQCPSAGECRARCWSARACRATLEAPVAGDHWLAIASRDRAGNLSEVRWLGLRVDGEPPRVDLEPMPAPVDRGGRWMPPGATVGASAEDGLAGVARLFLAVGEDVVEVAEQSASIELPASGEVTARAWAVDHAGNRSAETTLEVAIDRTPPTGEIRVGCPPASGVAAVVVPAECRIEVEVHDGESGVAGWTPRVDGAAAEAENLDRPWPAGSHLVEVAALDAVGNEARIGPFAFTVDDDGPEITWRVSSAGALGAGAETFYRPPVAVAVAAEDSPAGLDRLLASIDGASYEPVGGPLEIAGDKLWLRAVDGVGNVSETEASWLLDAMPPEIHLETEDGATIAPGAAVRLERGAAIRFRTIDHGAGVETATYSIVVESADILRRWWWSPPRDKPLPERLVFPWPGKLDLSVEAVDRLGNRQTARWQIVVRPRRGRS